MKTNDMRINIYIPKSDEGRVIFPASKVFLPSSKSISNRVLVINALSGNKYATPENVSDCDDTNVMIKWLHDNPEIIDIGAAGTAMRFSSALLAVSDGTKVITGTDRMKNRPISILVDALRSLGAKVDYVEKQGFPPLRITGNSNLDGGSLSLPGNVSSQYISALLMIGPVLNKGLKLTLTNEVVSRPYINLTLSLMKDYGADAHWLDDSTIELKPGGYMNRSYYVESDWSASSYWYEIVALSDSAEFVLPGLFDKSYQGDSEVSKIFENLGVKTDFLVDESGIRSVRLSKTSYVCDRLEYDFVNQPDLAQTFVVCCCMMNVPFHFYGLQSLKIKETDRIAALIKELSKMGFCIEERNGSELLWDGTRKDFNSDFAIDTYEDHRMAMAFAPCALKCEDLKINNPQVVSKSYPHFWEDLRSVGFVINEE